MISIRLVGGLCNQMFQYAFGRSLQGHDVQYFDHCNQYGYSLDKFNVSVKMTTVPEGVSHSESGLPYNIAEKDVADPSILYGYWQSEKYFLNVESELRQEFTLREPLSTDAQRAAEDISGHPNSVAVHVRRGDYLTWAAESHGALPLDYYLRAAKHIVDRFQDLRFYVFTDDPGWARQNFRFPYPFSVVNTTPHEDLMLISRCRHAIIANSSFSWWGAWLGADKTGTVIAPKNWFKTGGPYSENDSRDIVPERWTQL